MIQIPVYYFSEVFETLVSLLFLHQFPAPPPPSILNISSSKWFLTVFSLEILCGTAWRSGLWKQVQLFLFVVLEERHGTLELLVAGKLQELQNQQKIVSCWFESPVLLNQWFAIKEISVYLLRTS